MRGTGQSADIKEVKKRIWNDVMKKINSIYGNNRDVKEVKKKWNNIKGSEKARLDCSRREARWTGGGLNGTGEVKDEYSLILSSYEEMST